MKRRLELIMPGLMERQMVEAIDPTTPDDIDPPSDDFGDGGGDGDDDSGDDREYFHWVTVATFWTAPDAHIARLRIESQDIPCLIADENIVSTQWLWANAVGGIKLQVPAEDAAAARQLLKEVAPGVLSDEPDSTVYCPRCDSRDVTVERFSRRLAFLTILLLGAPLPFIVRRSQCQSCGHSWRGSPRRGFDLKQTGPPEGPG
jgi:hypothetical protein